MKLTTHAVHVKVCQGFKLQKDLSSVDLLCFPTKVLKLKCLNWNDSSVDAIPFLNPKPLSVWTFRKTRNKRQQIQRIYLVVTGFYWNKHLKFSIFTEYVLTKYRGCLYVRGCLPANAPRTEWQTRVKTLTCRKYVADGNNQETMTSHQWFQVNFSV